MKLRSVPSVDKSPTYDLVIPYFKNGTPEEWLKFQLNLNRVFVGQNLTTAVPKYAMIRRLLMGDVLSTFNAKARVLTTETNANLKICLNAVTETVFPKKAMQTQKRYMRRMLRKPIDLKIRDYFARYEELNDYLESFPPFGPNQRLPNDEVMEHAEFAIPNSWQKQMVLQGFNVADHTMDEFIEFCERLEFGESIFDTTHNKKSRQMTHTQKGKNGTNSTRNEGKFNYNNNYNSNKNQGNKRKTSHYCLYHGSNTTHNTDDCKVLKAQAERMSSAHGNKGGGKYNRQGSDYEKKKASTQAFQSFATDVVEKIIKKMKTSNSNKKKKVKNELEQFSMEEFNYEDFRELAVSNSDSSKSTNSESEE